MFVRSRNYLTLKVCTRQDAGAAPQSFNEVAVVRHIRAIDGEHPGGRYLRLMLGEFIIHGPRGKHRCLLYTPQGMTYTQFRNLLPDRMFDKVLLQQAYLLILIGIDFLHQASVVHTGMIICYLCLSVLCVLHRTAANSFVLVLDISPNNTLLGAQNPSVFSRIEQSESEHPSACKVVEDRTIYHSHSMH